MHTPKLIKPAVVAFMTTAFLMPARGQDKHQLDSLTRVITQAADTTTKIDALLDRANLFPPRSFDRAEADIKQAAQLAWATKNQSKCISLNNAYVSLLRKWARTHTP